MLTSNRDEAPERSPRHLTRERAGTQTLCFPRDEGAGGTWIAMSDAGRVVCVLNGAFEKHHHRPPYRRSRGLMVLDSFHFAKAQDFFEQYTFEGMEPFTLIMADGGCLWEARWDEQRLHLQRLDPAGRYLWSSATLYNAQWRQRRQQWFADWVATHPQPGPEDIMHFHRYGGEPDPWNGFVMNRHDLVRTVSITQVVCAPPRLSMTYHDLLRQAVKHDELSLARTLMPCPEFSTDRS